MRNPPLRYAVTGGRYYTNYQHVCAVLNSEPIDILIQGECPYGGADALAAKWAAEKGIPCLGVKAHFTQLGKAAGPIRNGWMLDLCGPIYKLIAFPGDRGTQNAINQAIKREILVRDERQIALEEQGF